MYKVNYIVADVETGGLDCFKNPVTQIAFQILDGVSLKEIVRYDTYIAPYDPSLYYDPKALSYSNITLEMLNSKGKNLDQAISEICSIIQPFLTKKSSKTNVIPVGHNIPFDIGFLQECFKKAGKNFYDFFSKNSIDTSKLGQLQFMPDDSVTSVSLTNLTKKLNISLNDAHNAMKDVEATSDVFRYYASKIRNAEASEFTSVEYSRDPSFKF